MFNSLLCVCLRLLTAQTKEDFIGYTYTYNVQTYRNREIDTSINIL